MRFLSRFRKLRAETPVGDAVNGTSVASIDAISSPGRFTDCERGDALLAAGSPDAALEAYLHALDSQNDAARAHLGQARAYRALRRPEDAADSLEVALAIDPTCVDAVALLAELRLEAGAADEAVRLLQRALDLAPDRGELQFILGLALSRRGDTASAATAYLAAIRSNPTDPAPHVNLGLIYLQQFGHADDAEAEFERALALEPGNLGALANLGLSLHDRGRQEEALALYERGLKEQHPDSIELRWNRGLANLSLGRFAAGWEDYELRFHRAGGRNLQRFDYPEWDGSALQGRLLVLAEQGLGDEIMFASCIPDLKALVSGIVLECAPRLTGLFTRSFPWANVHGVDRHAESGWLACYPDVRAKRPIGGLPRWLRTSADRFPAHAGYLRADAERVDSYRRRLSVSPGQRCVGLSWRGGTRSTRAALRSLPIEKLSTLRDVPGVRYVCLQHDLNAAEREFAREFGMVVYDEIATDLDAAAALITALDAVVSVPNTNANLAGALGRPVWIMLNAAPDWCWMASGTRSPWYPSASLLRARSSGDWHEVLAEVRSRLEALACVPAIVSRPC